MWLMVDGERQLGGPDPGCPEDAMDLERGGPARIGDARGDDVVLAANMLTALDLHQDRIIGVDGPGQVLVLADRREVRPDERFRRVVVHARSSDSRQARDPAAPIMNDDGARGFGTRDQSRWKTSSSR